MNILKFGADWCSPCKKLAPILKEIQLLYPDVVIQDIDIDEESNLAIQYKVRALPTLVFLKEGQESSRLVGLSTLEQIKKQL